MKEIEDDTNRWGDIPSSWIKKNNIVKISTLPKAYIDSMQLLSNYWPFFHRIRTKYLQLVWKNKRPWTAKASLRKKNRSGEIRLLDFRLYFISTVIKTVWYWHTKQKYISMELDKNPRSKSIHLWSINLWQRIQEYKIKKKKSLQ